MAVVAAMVRDATRASKSSRSMYSAVAQRQAASDLLNILMSAKAGLVAGKT